MKGIILAGGAGTRLKPATQVISKQALPIYDKPMIYYPLSMMMMADIREILIISTPRDITGFKQLLGDGDKWGIEISYEVQNEPKGIAEAFLIGEKFIGKDEVALILGDNVFYGNHLDEIIAEAKELRGKATIFGYAVEHPEEFGVVEFDEKMNVIGLEEKPNNPKSHYAVPGLYFYTNEVVEIAKNLKPSARGELEITDVNKVYLGRKRLKVTLFPRGISWIDTGTHKALLRASNFVEAVQSMQQIYIGCIEEIAYKKGYITAKELLVLANDMGKTEYSEYIKKIAGEVKS